MLRNYLKVALRNFLRNKGFTLINILGLTLGTASCILIFLIVRYETSFDNFHADRDRIYRVVKETRNASGVDGSAVTSYPLPKALRNDFTIFEQVTGMHYTASDLITLSDNQKFEIDHILFADSLFFDVFNFGVQEGNVKEGLSQPGKAFLTERLAKRYFSDRPAIGERIMINNQVELEVIGILADPPANSHLQFNIVASLPSLTKDYLGGFPLDRWGINISGFSYVKLQEGVTAKEFDAVSTALVEKYFSDADRETYQYSLQPLSRIHFDDQFLETNGVSPVNQQYLYILSVIGFFLLAIACINFVNLSTALAIKKSKEVGVRKTLGASKYQLAYQFLGETFVLTLLSVIIAMACTERALPIANSFLDKPLEIALFHDGQLIGFLLMLTVTVTILSGAYPALVLAGYNPVVALKTKITSQGRNSLVVRRGLVVFQFLISQTLIVAAIVITSQMHHFLTKPLGFDKEEVIIVPLPQNDPEKQRSFKSRLALNDKIKNISFSVGAPTSDNDIGTGFNLAENRSETYDMELKVTNNEYFETFGLELVAGRWFTEAEEKAVLFDLSNDSSQYTFVINETAAEKLGFAEPEEVIGRRIGVDINAIEGPVVGVVKDYHTQSFHQEISPVIMMHMPFFYYEAGLKVETDDLTNTIKHIEEAWTAEYPEYLFDYQFMEDKLAELYEAEKTTLTLVQVFSFISIFIGGLGLLGLVSFMVVQKTKEVGIRKVLGASISSIVFLFSKEFLRLVIFAFVIAAPIAWLAMDNWLASFAYSIDMNIWFFILAIVISAGLAFATVSYQSIKAALVNPVDSLKDE
ncbi:MAG: ABC transporter permease [Bacteroidota bacterium]